MIFLPMLETKIQRMQYKCTSPCKMSSHQILAQAVAQFRSDLNPLASCFEHMFMSTSLKLIRFFPET